MFGSLGEDEGRAPGAEGIEDFRADELVAGVVFVEGVADGLEGEAWVFVEFEGILKGSGSDEDFVGEGAFGGLLAGIDPMSDGTALHEDDGMVSVLAGDGGGEAEDKFGFGASGHEFEALRREVVAFVDDEVAVVGDEVFHDAFADETLDDGNVDLSGKFFATTAEAADLFLFEIKELGKALDPLVHELLAMDENESVDAALCDEPGRENGFSEGGGGGKDTGLVGEHGFACGFLFGMESALESKFKRGAGMALVVDLGFDFEFLEKSEDVIEAATREGEVLRVIFGAGDNTRFLVRCESHCLGFVELGVLEGGEAGEGIVEGGRKLLFGEVELVSRDDVERLGHGAGEIGFVLA